MRSRFDHFPLDSLSDTFDFQSCSCHFFYRVRIWHQWSLDWSIAMVRVQSNPLDTWKHFFRPNVGLANLYLKIFIRIWVHLQHLDRRQLIHSLTHTDLKYKFHNTMIAQIYCRWECVFAGTGIQTHDLPTHAFFPGQYRPNRDWHRTS